MFLGMEAFHQLVGADWAAGAALYAHEVDGLAPVKPAHQADFADTQRAIAVVPDRDSVIVCVAHQS